MQSDKVTVFELISGLQEGGAETLVKDYALLIDKTKFRIVVVTLFPSKPQYENYRILLQHNIDVVSLLPEYPFIANAFLQRLWNHFFLCRRMAKRLQELVKEWHPAVIHAHLTGLRLMDMISSDIYGIKIYYTCHNVPSENFRGKPMEVSSARNLCKNNNLRLIALHQEMAKELNAMFAVNNTVVIHNGIDFSRFKNVLESKYAVRRDLELPSDAFIVGHVGRFSSAKNHLFLIDIFNSVYAKCEKAFLLMIGSGTKMEEVQNKIEKLGLQNRCKILSHRTDIPQLLRAMDIFLFPSLFEGLPVSLVEAQVVGLRCVASDVITKESFFTERAVPLSLSKSAEEWAEVVLNDSIEGKEKHPIEAFDMNKEIKRLEKLYLGQE